MSPHSKRSSTSDLVCEANTKHKVWIRRCAAGSAPAVSPIVHARSAQVGIGERDSRRGWGQQLVVRGQLHSPMVKLVMRVAHVAPIRARCFNSKRTSFHVALELEHVESVDLRSEVRKADAVLLPSRVRASAATHSSASRGAAGVVCCFDSGCNTSWRLLAGGRARDLSARTARTAREMPEPGCTRGAHSRNIINSRGPGSTDRQLHQH